MYVTQAELDKKKVPIEKLHGGKEYLVDKIQTSTHGISHSIQKIKVMDVTKNNFEIYSEKDGIFWFDKKWIINIIENL